MQIKCRATKKKRWRKDAGCLRVLRKSKKREKLRFSLSGEIKHDSRLCGNFRRFSKTCFYIRVKDLFKFDLYDESKKTNHFALDYFHFNQIKQLE